MAESGAVPPTATARPRKLTMAEAAHIARLPYYVGTGAEIAREYGVGEALIRHIRQHREYNGVRFL